jgi:hypothetical protein
MMNLNGEQVSPIDPSTLPYTENRAAGPRFLLPLSVALSATLGGVSYFTSYDFSLLTILSPVLLLLAHLYLFFVLRNATHVALRGAQHDNRLDNQVFNSIKIVNEGHLSPERVAAVAERNSSTVQ